jgi:anion transporter
METTKEKHVHIQVASTDYDPLDMSNYRIEQLPKKEKSAFEMWMEKTGGPLAIVAFLFIYYILPLPYLENIIPAELSSKAVEYYHTIGAEAFKNANIAMMAIFVAAIILWITEAVPNYLTSLILIITMVLTEVIPEKTAYAQLGHKVMWLNILSFILASMLVKTGIAKRLALSFVIKYGKNASSIFISFIVINIILSAFISATTAKAAILLPIFMVIAAVYGATGGNNKNNFGRNLVLQNLLQINLGAGAFVTGSGANLLAASIIGGAIGSEIFFSDWMIAAFPIAVTLLFIGWYVGTRFIFPLSEEEKIPHIEGGMEQLKNELGKLGPINFEEIKSMIIFGSVLLLWVTDRFHGISPTAVAFLGAVIALSPKTGVVKWNDVDIPWHLLLFSAGAYTLGAGFKMTDLSALSVNAVFDFFGFGNDTPFWVLYLMLTGGMIFSSLVFQSKTMRTLIFVPIAIGTAQKFGFEILSLAMPVALLIEHVYALPFNSKPAALLYVTDHYSWSDTFKFGIIMLFIGWAMSILMGETYLRLLGYTPNGVFGLFNF